MYTLEKPNLAIYHAGVMGMKWGHRKARSSESSDGRRDYGSTMGGKFRLNAQEAEVLNRAQLRKTSGFDIMATKSDIAALKKSGLKMTKLSSAEESKFWQGLAKELTKTEKELVRERRRRAIGSVTKSIAAGALIGVTVGMLKGLI